MKEKICAVPEPVPDESPGEPSPNSSEMPQPVQPDLPIRWYALWVYRGLTGPVVKQCESREIPFYRPMRLVEDFAGEKLAYKEEPVLPSLLFVRTTEGIVKELQRESANRCIPYCEPSTRVPAPIADAVMEMFMLVVKKGAANVESVEMPIDKGDRVRVTDGMFKGAEGYIRRVHGSRRFVVAIEGVVAVALTHIPRQFLERVNPPA